MIYITAWPRTVGCSGSSNLIAYDIPAVRVRFPARSRTTVKSKNPVAEFSRHFFDFVGSVATRYRSMTNWASFCPEVHNNRKKSYHAGGPLNLSRLININNSRTTPEMSATILLSQQNAQTALQHKPLPLRETTLRHYYSDLWKSTIGHLSFIVVISFLFIPVCFTIFLFVYFGIMHGVLFLATVGAYNYLETKYHPRGETGRRWEAFIDLIGNLFYCAQ